MKHPFKALSLLALALLCLGCGGGERRAAEPGTGASAPRGGNSRPLSVKGSDTMVILGQRLAEEYMKANPGTVVQVNGGGSGTGIAALINGTADLAQASRPMTDAEKAKARQTRGADVVEHPVALDALAVFTHSSNRVASLTIEQVRAVFQGKVTNWRELGGIDAPIVLYGRESSSGTYDYFREHVLAKGDFTPRVQTLQGTAAIINAVGRDANGIGYGGIAYSKEVRALPISAQGKPAVAPGEQTVADGTYPLSRKLYYYYAANSSERVTRFAQWSVSSEAQALVTAVGYFPLSTVPGTTSTSGGAATTSSTP